MNAWSFVSIALVRLYCSVSGIVMLSFRSEASGEALGRARGG
jgi:hypothetical protein